MAARGFRAKASSDASGRRTGSARAVGLDMVEAGWRPTVENYLGRVTKPRILEAVREARGEDLVRLIDHLKKADMAKEAERLLDGTGWLPEPLRGAGLDDAPDAPSEDSDALPEFLIGDDGDERRQRGGRRVRARRHGRRMRQRRAGHVPPACFHVSHLFHPKPGPAPGFIILRSHP